VLFSGDDPNGLVATPMLPGSSYEIDGITFSCVVIEDPIPVGNLEPGCKSYLKMEVVGKSGNEATPIFEKFMAEVSKYRRSRTNMVVEIKIKSGIQDFGTTRTLKDLEISRMMFTKEQLKLLERLAAIFDKDRCKQYEKIGMSSHYNLLFSGLPGSGKSNFVQAIALKLRRNIYKVTVCTKEILWAINGIQMPSIIVLEDADELVHNRASGTDEKSFLGPILSLLDGMSLPHLFVLTTNYPQKLDVALSRAGRISVIMKFGWAEEASILKLCINYLDEFFPKGSGKKVAEVIIGTGAKYTMAMLTNICRTAIFDDRLPEKDDYKKFETEAREFEKRWNDNPIVGTLSSMYS
jgi:SpoVK/Ycf46/Vps4 family AAA+-type ATPase